MPRARLIPPDFWTAEAVVDCPPMARLLLLGLSTFADDFGVLPLRPRTLRLQVFPGDALDDAAVGVLIDELAARGLVRRYTVEGVDYLSIVDWEHHQRPGRRARRRWPACPSLGADAASGAAAVVPDAGAPEAGAGESGPVGEAACGPAASSPPPLHHSKPSHGPSAADDPAADAAWLAAIEGALRRGWGGDLPGDVALHAARWRAGGHDLARAVLPAVGQVVRGAVEANATLRLERVDRVLAGAMPPPAAMAAAIANHGIRPL